MPTLTMNISLPDSAEIRDKRRPHQLFLPWRDAIRLPVDGAYGLRDGGDPLSNCKYTCGFKKL